MIQAYSDNKAELYYNKTYTNKPKTDKKNASYMFNTKVKDEIDQVVLTELPDDNRNNDSDENNNSIFNDKFFIYRPEKKRFDNNPEDSHFPLDYSRNQTMKSGLLTLQNETNEDEILNIVSNMTKQPLNEKILEKVQQKGAKKTGKNTYNFSTTDKSKGDSQHTNNILTKSNNYNSLYNYQKQENNQMQELMSKREAEKYDSRKHDSIKHDSLVGTQQHTGSNNPNFSNSGKYSMSNLYSSNVNLNQQLNLNMMKSPSPVTPYQQSGILTNKQGLSMKKSLELIDINKPDIPCSSKNKVAFNQDSDNSSKSPLPGTVKQQKLNLALNSLKSNQSNKVIEYKQIKLSKASSSNPKFANLLYSSENNSLKPISSQRSGSNQQYGTYSSGTSNGSRIPIKSIKNIEINKYNAEIKSPVGMQGNNLLDIRQYELQSRAARNDIDENIGSGHKPTLSVHLDKIFRTRQEPPSNYDNFVSSNVKKEKTKSQEKIPISSPTDDDFKIQSERLNYAYNIGSNNNQMNNYNDINGYNSSKVKNYLNHSKKISMGSGAFNEDSNRVVSGLTSTKTVINNNQMKIKYNLNDKTPSINSETTKNKTPANYYQVEQKMPSSRGFSKGNPIGSSLGSDLKANSKKGLQKRMKSGDFYSNNYFGNNINSQNMNINHNVNVNTFLQKIASTRSIQTNNGENKIKKINFSPQSYKIR